MLFGNSCYWAGKASLWFNVLASNNNNNKNSCVKTLLDEEKTRSYPGLQFHSPVKTNKPKTAYLVFAKLLNLSLVIKVLTHT